MPLDQAERVLEVVSSALEIAVPERAAFLDQACHGDPELRAEVESLLGQEEHLHDFIEEPPAALAAQALETAAEEPFVSRRFGHYQTIRELGRGGLGTVYLAARADDAYQKEVALKLLRRGLDTQDVLQRFRNERQILARLEHPNIARLIDGGTSGDGLPYFVMEYVQGEPLHTYCEHRRLTTDERLQLFRTVCTAVTYAHQHLVIHRDLKPSNILVTGEGEVKLLDFGIAKVLGADDAAAFQTMTELRVMTPEYASPEQVRGENITTATDVYSLGVVLYELLTGATPYRLTSRSPKELERAITEVEPPRPSTVSPSNQQSATRNPKSLRGDLDNIVLMAMRKEPARRYTSVGQFSEDIRRHLAGLPVIARKDTFAYRSAKFVRRHRVGVAAACLILTSLIGGVVATLVQARTAQREKVKAEAISAFLQRMLTAPDPNRHAGAPPTVKEILDDASKRLASSAQLAREPEVRAELQRTIGVTYLSIGQYALAEQNLSAALETETKLFGENAAETLKTAAQLATLWGGSTGDYAKASQFYRQKLPLLRAGQKKGTISADYLIGALNSLALVQRAQGNSKEAEMLLREEVALGSQVSPEFKNDIGIAETVLALTLADQGKFEEAIKIVREKLAGLRGGPQPQMPELCATLTGLGSFLLENGGFTEAEENLREAEPIYRQLYDPANMQLGDNLRLQAQALSVQGQYAEAETKINETLRIYRAAGTPQYINYATALIVQGVIYSHTGRIADAENLLRDAVRNRTQNAPAKHFLSAAADGALGEFLTGQGRFAEAEPLLLGSYESLKRSQAANSPRIRLALRRLVTLYQGSGRLDVTEEYRRKLSAETGRAR
jgi:serine/threonine protein kinase